MPVGRAAICPPAYSALATQPEPQNVTQSAPRSGTKEEEPRKVKTYFIRLSLERQLEHLQPSPVFANAPDNCPRVRASTPGARTSPSPFSSLLSASKNAAGRKPSYNVLATRNVTRFTGRLIILCPGHAVLLIVASCHILSHLFCVHHHVFLGTEPHAALRE